MVAPLAGAWIETGVLLISIVRAVTSRPSRARGLKLTITTKVSKSNRVAPLAGAWIETAQEELAKANTEVAPLAGAWIETIR